MCTGCLRGSGLDGVDLHQAAGGQVQDEAAHGIGAGDERRGLDAGDRLAHAVGQVGEGPRRPGRPRAGLSLQGGAQLLVGEGEHAAAGVVDEEDLLGAQQVLADRQGADRVLGDQAAGVADDVRLARGEPQGREDVHARVHAGHDRDLLRPLGRQAAPGENLGGVGGVAGDKSLGDGHGSSVPPGGDAPARPSCQTEPDPPGASHGVGPAD